MMNNTFSLLVPVLMAFVALYGSFRHVDVYATMVRGAGEGLKVVAKILPPVIIMLSAITLLRASGFFDIFSRIVSPVMYFFGIPPETSPILLIRPFSGTGALAVVSELLSTYGPDSYIGRTASVMMGSTETTFYVLAIYFGAVKTNKLKKAVLAALLADLTSYVISALTVRLFMS